MKAEAGLEENARITVVKDECAKLTRWLLEDAYPIWSIRGIDRVRGGFHERVTLTGEPTEDPRRARVQPRQVHAFSLAPSFGWSMACVAASPSTSLPTTRRFTMARRACGRRPSGSKPPLSRPGCTRGSLLEDGRRGRIGAVAISYDGRARTVV